MIRCISDVVFVQRIRIFFHDVLTIFCIILFLKDKCAHRNPKTSQRSTSEMYLLSKMNERFPLWGKAFSRVDNINIIQIPHIDIE